MILEDLNLVALGPRAGGRVGLDHRERAGTEVHRRAVARGGDRDRRYPHRDARRVATGPGRGAVRSGHDRSGHHRCRSIRVQETRGGLQLPGTTLRTPARGRWAETTTVLGADLMAGDEDPRRHAPKLLNRALAALPTQARAGRVRLRADAGYFAGQLARAALFADIEFAIGRLAHPPAVAAARGPGRVRLDRRGRHGRRAGRGHRLLPRLVARGDPAADPPGPPRRGRRARLRRPPRPYDRYERLRLDCPPQARPGGIT